METDKNQIIKCMRIKETRTLDICPRCKVNRKKKWHIICLKCKWEIVLDDKIDMHKEFEKYKK